MAKKLLNLSTSWSKKFVIEGKILLLSPRRWSGNLEYLIGDGNCCKFDSIDNKLSSLDYAPDSLG